MPLLTPHVPSGLIDLMKDLAKEVLRDKPENIYEFAVVHFEKLVLERDGSLDKGYEEFSAFEAQFDGQQRFAVPSNCGYICQKPIKIQPIPQPRKSKSEIMASFQAMESINEEDALASAVPGGASPYTDEKYQNAIYVIQRYFRRYMERKKNPSNTKNESLSAFTAAIIIQRTMRRLFSNKIKLTKDKEKDSGSSLVNAGAVKLVQDDMDNVSEAASYTSSSTIQMLADGQEGRENRLASGQSRRQHEEVLDGNGNGDGDGDGVVGDVGVVGAADCSSSMEFKEPKQDEEPPSTSSSATAVMVADDDEEHSHSVVAATEMDRKSIADENGNTESIPEEKSNSPSASTADDTSTAHNIGILLTTKIGSNYNHQNLPNKTNTHNEININASDEPTQINTSQLNIIPAGLIVPLNYPQSSSLGSTPDTLPVTSPHLEETQETFVVHSLHEYANENGKNNDASSYIQGDGRIRKFDSDTGESLKIYDVYYHDVNDQEFSDSLNESTMEKDSLEPEELDADSLELNENVVHHQHHMSDIVKRDARQDDGSLYGDKNDDEEGDEDSNKIAQNVQKFIEIERVPTYLYGIHPARTPTVERRNRSRNSEESHKVPDDKKYLEATTTGEVDDRSPTEEKSEEESLESKGSTSEESSVTQIENNLELRETKGNSVKEQPVKDGEETIKCPGTKEKLLIEEHLNSSIVEGQLVHQNETIQGGALNDDLKTKASRENIMTTTTHLKPNDSQQSPKKLTEPGGDSINQNETNLLEDEKAKNYDLKLEEESQKNTKTNQKANNSSSSKLEDSSELKEETTNLVKDSMIHEQIDSSLKEILRNNDLEKHNLEENALSSVNTASAELIDSKNGVLTENIEETTSKLEDSLRNKDLEELNLKETELLASTMKTASTNLIDSEKGILAGSIEETNSKLEDGLGSHNLEENTLLSSIKSASKNFIDSERGILAERIQDITASAEHIDSKNRDLTENIEETTSKLEDSLRNTELEELNLKESELLASMKTASKNLIDSEKGILAGSIEETNSKLEDGLRSHDLEENTLLSSVKSASKNFIDSERGILAERNEDIIASAAHIDSKNGDLTENIEETTSKLEDSLRNKDLEELNLKETELLASTMKTASKNLIDSEKGILAESIKDTTSKLEDSMRSSDIKESNLKEAISLNTTSEKPIDSKKEVSTEKIEEITSKQKGTSLQNENKKPSLASISISSIGDEMQSTKEPHTENRNGVISSKSNESNNDVNSKSVLEKHQSKNEDEDPLNISEIFNDQRKTQKNDEKSSLGKQANDGEGIEPVDKSEKLVFGEENVEQKSQISDNKTYHKNNITSQSEKITKSNKNLCEAEQTKNDSSSSFEDTTNIQVNHEPMLIVSSQPSEDGKGKLSDHDQEIESQLLELQTLNDHLPGTNLEDITSDSHLRHKRSEDTANHTISQCDDNNNLEDSHHQGKDTNPGTSGETTHGYEESSTEENEKILQKQQTIDKKTSKSSNNVGNVQLVRSEIEENKNSASVSSKIPELSQEIKVTIAGGDEIISKKETDELPSQHYQQTSEQKDLFLDNKSEDVLGKSLGVSNKVEVKISASDSDSFKETIGSDHISDNFIPEKTLPSPPSEDTKLFIMEEIPKNLESQKPNGKKEGSLNLDQKESETISESLASPIHLQSLVKSKNSTLIDSHSLTLNKEDSTEATKEENSINKKEISLMENKPNVEDKPIKEERTISENYQNKSSKTLGVDTNEQFSISEENAAKEVKNNTREESSNSNNGIEHKDETKKLLDIKEENTSENSDSSDDEEIISDKMAGYHQSSKEHAAENLKEEKESIKLLDSSSSETKEEGAKVNLQAETSQNIQALQNSEVEQSNFDHKQTKSTDQLAELLSANISAENVRDTTINEEIRSEHLEKAEASKNLENFKLNIEAKSLKNEKLDEEVMKEKKKINEEKHPTEEDLPLETKTVVTSPNNTKFHQEPIEIEKVITEPKKSPTDTRVKTNIISETPVQELDLETKAAEANSNKIKSKQESKEIKENEKVIQPERNSTDTVLETPIQDAAASNKEISTDLSQSKKIDEEHSISLGSPDIVACDGSSAETSADFSSIGKDLEFFEDTIKYLKNATEHLGGMEEVFEAKKKEDADVLNHSAVLIQSAFRGYQVRKGFKELSRGKSEAEKSRNKPSVDNKKTDSESNDEKKAKAAVKIQSVYRGHRVRKDQKKKLNETETERQQSPGNILPPNIEATNYIQSPTRNVLGSNLVKTQIPVAVIHPIKYTTSTEGHLEKVPEATTTNSRSILSLERSESTVNSPSKQSKPSPTTSVKTIPKNMKTSPQKITRQKPLEKKPNVKKDSSDDHKEESPILQKKSVEKNDQTFIRDPLDETVKMDRTQIMGNKKLTTVKNSSGYGNKSKNNLKNRTPSTADSLRRPKGSTNARDQFRRKGKSMSINGKTQNQESFDLETIKKELLSTTINSPPKSGSNKKTGAGVKSGKQKSPGKHSNGTKIPQKSPSKTNGHTSKQIKEAKLPSESKTDSINSDLPKTITGDSTEDKKLEEVNNNTKKPTLNKTYTVRSSLNEVEHLRSPLQSNDEISESLFDSLKRDVDKLKANVHEKSAVKIQKTFRGFRTRKNLNKGLKSSIMGGLENPDLKTSSVALGNDIEASSKHDKKEVTTKDIPKEIEKDKENKTTGATEIENSMLLDKLADPILDKAAIKIQKTYKGYKTRKNYKTFAEKRRKFDTKEDTEDKIETNVGIVPEKHKLQQDGEIDSKESVNDSLEKSAIKIQKTFRGYQSRKQLQSKKISEGVKNEDSDLLEVDARNKTPTDALNKLSKSDDKQKKENSDVFESLQKSIPSYKNALLNESAKTIQKHYRGYKIREDIKRKSIRRGISTNTNILDMNGQVNEEPNEKEKKLIEHQGDNEKNGSKEKEENQAKSVLKKETGPVLTESECKEIPEAVDQSRSANLDKSATVIQKNFRGYRTRQHLKRDNMVIDRVPTKETISEQEVKIEESTRARKDHDDIQKQDVIGSFDEKENQNETLQKSATTIQKTFRGYKTRKNLLSKKTSSKQKEDTQKPVYTENLIQPPKDQTQAEENEASNKFVGIQQAEIEQKIEKPTDGGNLQKSAEEQTSTSTESSSPHTNINPTCDGSSSEDVHKIIHSKSNYQKRSTKSSSAGAVLENAASTIQKAYRNYHAKINNNLPIKSYSNGIYREAIPKEALENSDESSTFIGPDTSFDLSDVESVETKSEKVFNSDKFNSSEAHTPTNNCEEVAASTLNIKTHSEDREIDNESVNTPQKLRFKRSLIEPTAPPLDEILKSEETVSTSPKLKWFVGDDPIIPSNSNSSKSSSPASASSSSVDPLIPNYSKFNNLSSIDAFGDNLNSNQQHLASSINSAVVSTSSLLLPNNTEKLKQNTLNNNSGIVSANEEEILKKEENNLEKIDQSEDISQKLENDVEIASSAVKSNENELNEESKANLEDNNEEKQEDTKEVATDLCKNCAEGIHEGGICSEDLIKTPKTDQTILDPVDPIKQFVLMEELNNGHSPVGKSGSSVISSEKEEELSNLPSTGLDSSNITVDEANSQAPQNEALTEQLSSSKDCPAISLIPPSSEDDTSERESSLEANGAQHKDDRVKNEESDKDQSEDIDEVKKESNEDTKRKENVEDETEPKSVATDNKIKMDDVTPKSENLDFVVDINEENKNTSFNEKKELLDDHLNEIKSDDNSSKDEKSKYSSNEIEEKRSGRSNSEEPLEDAFKTLPGEEFKTVQQRFEDDFSDSKEIEEASEEKAISSELDKKALSPEEAKTDTDVGKVESLDKIENKVTSKDLENGNEKVSEVNNGVLEGNSSEAKDLESKIKKEQSSHELTEENEKLTDQIVGEETARKSLSENKIENQSSQSLELQTLPNASKEDIKLEESIASKTIESSDNTDKKINKQDSEQNEEIVKEQHEEETQKDVTKFKQESKIPDNISSSLEDESSTKAGDGVVKSEVSKVEVQGTSEAPETKITKKDEKSLDSELHEGKTTSEEKDHGQLQEDLDIAAKLIESSLSDPQAKLLENQSKSKESIENNKISLDPNEISKINEEPHGEDKNQPDPQVEAKLEKLIEDNLKPTENIKNTVDMKDLPTENSSQETVEEPCIKTIIPPIPYSAASSDPDESELESTTTKAESTATTPGYDETSEADALDIPPSKPDALDAMTEKLREPEEMVARMRQRRASEHKISIDSLTDQQAVFEEPISQPIKPMQHIQKFSSTEDDLVLQKLERGDTTRESSAQSESVVYGDSTSQLTESEDTFNENLDLHSLHRMNTIAANRSTFKPSSHHLYKSVTIDNTVKYIDPEKSTEESGSSFCMDDALSEDVRKKMMAYSVSEADSDYYEVGDQTTHPHDDFNISTALDNFPSTDTDTTIVSAATKIQAGARGFLTRRRIRRASMGTKASLTEERNLSFGNEAIGESLDQLAEEEDGRRQFNRQTGVNSLPSALEHSDEILSPFAEDIPIGKIASPPKHFSIKIEDEKHIKGPSSSAENDVNDYWLEKPEDDSSHIVSNLEATLARRLTLQRGDAMRNDSTPDDENGNGKQVDLAKNNTNSSMMGTELFHEKTMVESTTTTTTRTTTERRNYSDAAVSNKKEKIKWFALRQNSMPVQIDSEIFRVLPKHMRKRIKSAEGEKPKRIRLPRD